MPFAGAGTSVGAHDLSHAALFSQGVTDSASSSRRLDRRASTVWKERALLSVADIPLFAVGLVFSFLSAWLCVRWLLRYIATHTFTPFAWYRIAFGIVVLATAYSGLVTWAD